MYETIVAWSFVFGLMNWPTVSPITCAMPLEDAASDLDAAFDLASDTISREATGSPARSFSSADFGSSKISLSICRCFSSSVKSNRRMMTAPSPVCCVDSCRSSSFAGSLVTSVSKMFTTPEPSNLKSTA